jgi:hypothetical protein
MATMLKFEVMSDRYNAYDLCNSNIKIIIVLNIFAIAGNKEIWPYQVSIG